jgi:hypothetical protein
LALLLASFGSNVLTEKEDEENKIGEAIDRIQRFIYFLIAFILRLFDRNKKILKDISIENNINDIAVNNQVCLTNHFSY